MSVTHILRIYLILDPREKNSAEIKVNAIISTILIFLPFVFYLLLSDTSFNILLIFVDYVLLLLVHCKEFISLDGIRPATGYYLEH